MITKINNNNLMKKAVAGASSLLLAPFSFLVMLTFLVSSCSKDFLEVTSPSDFPIEDYYSKKVKIEEALVSAYAPLHWFDYGTTSNYNALNLSSDIMSDDMYPNGGNDADCPYLQLAFNFSVTPLTDITGIWLDSYSGVKRANDVIKYVDWATDMTDAEKSNVTTQARLLRAYYYNLLWKYYGNIPFFFENLEAPYTAPQLSADEVYAKVIEDLEDIIANGNLKDEWDDVNVGRVTRPMAYMLYTEMVMYQNDQSRYAKALGFMQNIISSGKFGLLDNFADVWTEAGEWSKESIFEINYYSVNGGRAWDNGLGAGGSVNIRLCGPRGFIAKKGDPYEGVVEAGWGFGYIPPKSIRSFEDGDARKDVTGFDIWEHGDAEAMQDAGWMFRERTPGSYYSNGKYLPWAGGNAGCTGSGDMNFNNNFRVYRYSETLLNAAELLLKTGGSASQAADYVNQVRNRAGLASLNSVDQDDILNERRHEFMGEGKRYWDLVRTGNAATVLKASNDDLGFRTKDWDSHCKYLPIPQDNIDADPNLKQNPGY